MRWLTRLDPAGEVAYREAVRPLAGRIERALGPEVLAIRSRPASWRRARATWRRRVAAAIGDARRGTVFALADVRDCYGSITPETLAGILGPDAAPAVAILDELRAGGVRGLPVGPDPSAALGNAVLARLDDAVRRAGATHVRWADDLVLWGHRGDVVAAMAALERTAGGLGLSLHDRKTRIVGDRAELAAASLGARHSSIIAAP